MEYDMIEIGSKVRKVLPKKRFWHTVGVAYTAADMALIFGENQTRALVAGLLHDCAKYLTAEEQLAECIRHNLPVSEIEQKHPSLLHAKLGAYYAKKEYGVKDEGILSAITWHTTGRPEMTVLEKIIYLADYIEPMRNQPAKPSLDEIRKLCFTDLDRAVYMVAWNTLDYLKSENTPTDPETEKTLQYYAQIAAPNNE
ncbi:MAG: bis(5'-nucleosyl)-tetraphosphatase (symmetrical) YqeK [Lachnospiraceae bacterium]|nr:bis(5'-nucleosyl)-tetraphosphatase (symmetrical) YqeK [Lachnospiraceae bacterium]